MKLKKINGIILALSTPALLFGCQNSASQLPVDSFVANDFVELYDYKSVSISKEDLNVTQDEIDSVILFDLQSGGYFVDEKIRPVQYGDFVVMDITETSGGVSETEEDAFVFIADDENLSDSEQEFYDNIVDTIPGEKIEFSIADFDEFGKGTVVKYEVTVLKIKSLITELSDNVVKEVYGYVSLEQARKEFKKKIIEGRIFDIIKNAVFENSTIINIPLQKEQYVTEMKNIIKNLSNDEGVTEDEYCYSNFEMTAEEYYSNISSFFDEYMIIKAISEKEGLEYSEKDIENIIEQIDSGVNPEAEEYSFFYSTIGILYSMRSDDIKNILVGYVTDSID